MEILQFVTESLGDASYLLVTPAGAIAVDPQRDVRPYRAAAEARGARIDFVFETHVHNDYLSGGRELAEGGARIVAPAAGKLEFPHIAVNGGEQIIGAGVTLEAMATPGHTFEHTAYIARDENGNVLGAFTGGAMLMAAAGRTDLLGPDNTEQLTRLQWDSVQRLSSILDGSVEILPTHGAGSFCSSSTASAERRGLLRAERTRNPALVASSWEAFAAVQLARKMPMPRYYQYMAPINRAGPPVYGTPPVPVRLSPGEVESAVAAGVTPIDVRPRGEFAAGHIPGSICIEESTSLLAYVSWVTPFDAPLLIVAGSREQAERITVDLFRIGYEDVRGFGLIDEWRSAGFPSQPLPLATADDVVSALRSASRPVLDVRFGYEHLAEPVPGAVECPADQLDDWAPWMMEEHAIVTCQSGLRASMIASVLRARGKDVAAYIDGGAPGIRSRLAT